MKPSAKVVSRRHIQVALGFLWLLDAALQLQHRMFTSAFATQVINPAAQGQPLWVRGPIHFGVHIFLTHPAIFNGLIFLSQLGLGVLILWKRTAKLGLLTSVAWGLFVWVIGEAYGGIFGSQASLFMGAPGAALMYVLLALAVLPSAKKDDSKSDEKPTRQTAAFWLVLVWALIWFGGLVWQVTTAGQNSVSGIRSMILANADGAPRWLANTDTYVAKTINSFGTYTQAMPSGKLMSMAQMAQMPTKKGSGDWFTPVLAVVMLFVSLGVFIRGVVRKSALAVGTVLSLFFWVVGQSLGNYYTGLATDPSTGPLIVLLAVALWGCTDLDVSIKRFLDKTEDILV